MVIPEGYKQTEMGVIPEEWNIITFEKCFKIIKNNTLSRAELNEDVGTVKNIHYGDILVKFGNVLDCSSDKLPYISNPKKNTSSMYLMDGDIVIADTAEDETVGKAVEISNIKSQKIVSGLHTIPCRATSPEMFANGWLGYYINHSTYHNQLLPFITGTKVSAISKSSISSTQILVPSIEEQKHIADALSDIDGMISSLVKLIEKKKAVKQGAMQELLTGKKRLPGFDGKWSMFVFCELFDFIPNNAFTRAQMSDNGNVKNIHYGDILTLFGSCIDGDNKSIPYVNQDVDLSSFSDRCYLQSGDIIIADTAEDETVGKALEVDNVNSLILAGQHTLLCRPKIKFADKFLGYYLNAECYHDQLLPFVVGTKVSSVSKSSVAQTKLFVPDFEEQNAIASILSDVDNEIDALEQKLEKARQLKQGMMQQLLTGKIRLV